MAESTDLDYVDLFGVDPVLIVNRHRAHWIVEAPDEEESILGVSAGALAVRARDGGSNPISTEACAQPNFVGSYQDDFDCTYRYYYFKPLSEMPSLSSEEAAAAFVRWVNEGPKLAEAAGLYVGIKVMPASADPMRTDVERDMPRDDRPVAQQATDTLRGDTK